MRHKRFKIRGEPLDDQAFTKPTLLKLFKDIVGITPDDIDQEGTNFVFTFTSVQDVERVLGRQHSLQTTHHLKLYFPHQFLRERSVMVNELSNWIIEQHNAAPPFSDNIADSIENENESLVVYGTKFCNSRTLKVTFQTVDMVTQTIAEGFYCYGVHVPSFRVKRERFYNITQCFRCYEYTHQTNECEQTAQKCSICAKDHHYSACTSTRTQCLLCKGKHLAISHKCPRRQEVIKNLVPVKPPTSSTNTSSASNTQSQTATPFNVQDTIFPELPGGGPTAQPEAAAHQSSQWGPSSRTASHSLSQQSPPTSLPDLSTYGMIHALTDTATRIAGSNTQLFVKILNILYSANGLPTFIVPDIVYTISTGATSSHSAPRPIIEVNTDDLTDLLSAAATSAAASPTTETPVQPTHSHSSTEENVEPTTAATLAPAPPAAAPLTSKASDRPIKRRFIHNRTDATPEVKRKNTLTWNQQYENDMREGKRKWILTPSTIRFLSNVNELHPDIIDPTFFRKYPAFSAQMQKIDADKTITTTPATDSSDEEVSVGKPSPPQQKAHHSSDDFLLETTSNDSTAMTTRSKMNK